MCSFITDAINALIIRRELRKAPRMIKKKRKVHKGTLSIRTTKRDPNGEVEETLEEEDFGTRRTARPVAMIRDIASLKMTANYTSMSVEIGIEMPWPVRPGKLEDLEAGFTKIERLIFSKLKAKKRVLQTTLSVLAKK